MNGQQTRPEKSPGPTGARIALRAGIALSIFVAFAAFLVMGDPADVYLWVKALHIMAVIAWMAGLFYLPRLFIYHSETKEGSEGSEVFKVMERRLYRIIMNPAMMMSWALGLYLAIMIFQMQGGWLHAKLLFVVLMTIAHLYLGRSVKAFGRDERPLDPRRWRMINEIPTVLMMIIVVLVVVKPF